MLPINANLPADIFKQWLCRWKIAVMIKQPTGISLRNYKLTGRNIF